MFGLIGSDFPIVIVAEPSTSRLATVVGIVGTQQIAGEIELVHHRFASEYYFNLTRLLLQKLIGVLVR